MNNQPGAITARGTFNDGGTFFDKGNNATLASFADGAFVIHHPHGNQSFSINTRTCAVKVTITGDFTLNGGVGRYQGLSGSGTYVGKVTGVLPRNPNGTCNGRSQPTAQVLSVTAHGSVAFKP